MRAVSQDQLDDPVDLDDLVVSPSGDNPGANRWFLESTPIQMLTPGGSIWGRLT